MVVAVKVEVVGRTVVAFSKTKILVFVYSYQTCLSYFVFRIIILLNEPLTYLEFGWI